MPALKARFKPLIPVSYVLVAIASLQLGASIAKWLFPLIGAEGASALRQSLAAIMLFALFRPWRNLPKSRADWQMLGIYGLCLGIMNLSFYMAISRIPLGVGVALEFTGPLAVALLSSTKPRDFLWVGCAVVGLLGLLPLHQASASLDPLGVVLALFAGICWAGYILYGQKVSAKIPAFTAVSIGTAMSALIAAPVGLIHAGSALFTPQVLMMAAALAFLSGALPYSLEMIALNQMPTRTFSILMSLEPAVGALIGLWLLSEHLSPVQWLSITLIVIASAGSSLGGKARGTEPLPNPD